MITEAQKQFYDRNGYHVVKGLFSEAEVVNFREHYMHLRKHGEYPGDTSGVDVKSNDPLKRYPRMIHMHRWDELSLRWMIDPRLGQVMAGLLGREPYAVQTMLYFKPPGSRGQALHQDNFYLKVKPGTCMAAWMALDPCDVANGCMQIVPGSQHWEVLCTEKADTSVSFTDVTVPLPPEAQPVPVLMDPGDVLFFNGSLVHGSFPNTTSDRFRRALIGHYIEGDSEMVGEFYHPALRFDGTTLEHLSKSQESTTCGVWVERDGTPVIELAGQQAVSRKHE